MRLYRFEQHLLDLVRAAGSPAVTAVDTFADAGYRDKPAGLLLRLANGGQVHLQLVRTSPPGGDVWDEPERIIEGPPPEPVPVPTLDAGRVRLADLEAWLVALIVNSGSREISSVRGFSGDPRSYHRYGLGVRFHSGAEVFGLFVHTLPRGQAVDPAREFEVLEVV